MTITTPRTIAGGLAALALGVSLGSAHAGTITYGSTGLTGTGKLETFENPSANTYETAGSQFAANGITFSGATAVLINKGDCNPGSLGGKSYVAVGVTDGCKVAQAPSTVSMLFSQDVQELSFLYVTNNTATYRFEALLDGNVVSSTNVSWPFASRNGYFLFSGSAFDEIRFTSTTGGNWFWLDNVAWNPGPATGGSVPEPGSLALVALAGLGLVAARRRAA